MDFSANVAMFYRQLVSGIFVQRQKSDTSFDRSRPLVAKKQRHESESEVELDFLR